ncbi:hypothetical protein ACOMHN_053131 [Nucella lapillus]
MSMMRARVQGHRWVDHPAAAVIKAKVPGQWVDRPAAVVIEASEQGRCWIDHPAVAVIEARVQGVTGLTTHQWDNGQQTVSGRKLGRMFGREGGVAHCRLQVWMWLEERQDHQRVEVA